MENTWKEYMDGKVGQHAKRKNNNRAVLVLENHLLHTLSFSHFRILPVEYLFINKPPKKVTRKVNLES